MVLKMTLPTHDEVIAWIDRQLAVFDETIANFQEETNPLAWVKYVDYNLARDYRASLLANRDVLERHKEVVQYKLPTRKQREAGMGYQDSSLAYSQCTCGYVETFTAGDGQLSTAIGRNKFPCPTYLDILQRIAEVM